MKFKAEITTAKEYHVSDVIVAFHACLEKGLHGLEDNNMPFHADIIKDIIAQQPIISEANEE